MTMPAAVNAASPLALERDGAVLAAKALRPDDLARLLLLLEHRSGPGSRLFGDPTLGAALETGGSLGSFAAALLGRGARPVRAILFDKTARQNWSLPWHQDRVIAVRERVDAPGFGPWSRKAGVPHVAPPFEVLAGMLTVRLHLDDVPVDNAPLLIAPGSHALGRVAEGDIPGVVAQCGTVACLANAGDAWIYATPILHASQAATKPSRRRVLQVDYSATDLPGALAWHGV
jgi:hypothetical protein